LFDNQIESTTLWKKDIKTMASTFICYIDEAGCDGFRFDKGSSEWFILAGVIIERSIEPQVTSLVDYVRKKFKMPPKKHIHFRKLDHAKKKYYCNKIAQNKLVVSSVCVDKTEIKQKERFKVAHRLYFYFARYLIERVSWYVRDQFNPSMKGDGTVKLVFSNKSTMPYERFRDYMNLLSNIERYFGYPIEVYWPSIGNIESKTPAKVKGLQIADACASALFNAFELDTLRQTEHSYVDILKPVIFNRNSNYLSYGLKIPCGISKYKTDEERKWIFNYK